MTNKLFKVIKMYGLSNRKWKTFIKYMLRVCKLQQMHKGCMQKYSIRYKYNFSLECL